MKYRAVIFDLGGTLSRSADQEEYRNAARQVAAICSAPIEKFVELWFANSARLGTGHYRTWQDYIDYICGLLDIDVPQQHLAKAAEINLAATRNQISAPHEGAVELLVYLKSNGYKLGLISDCFYDVPKVWPDTPYAPHFDVALFSCEVGMNKGNPRIFQIALETLDVEPEKCIYIADGMRNELSNAAGLGILAVQLHIPGEIYDSPIREEWRGPKISSLHEVHNLLK